MNILYGIVGDGFGHAVRSSVIIDRLIEEGHDVHIVVSGDPCEFLRERYPSLEITQIWGLHTVIEDNEVQAAQTVALNARRAVSGLPKNIKQFIEVSRSFDPDIVLSDFESWSWFFGQFHQVPVLAVADHFLITRCSIAPDVVEGYRDAYRTTRLITQARIPSADHYVVPSFVDVDEKKERTTLIPPILRQQVLQANATDGDHVIAYQTPCSEFRLAPFLQQLDRPVRLYGSKLADDRDVRKGNVLHRPFSEQTFIEDLASAEAVVAFSGFKLITEALHFGKPFYAIPVQGQFEHMVSARYVDKLGYGTCELEPDADSIEQFLDRIPHYEKNLRTYPRRGNRYTFECIDRLLERYAGKPSNIYPAPRRQRAAE